MPVESPTNNELLDFENEQNEMAEQDGKQETKIVIKKKQLTRSIFTIDEEECDDRTVLSSRTGGWGHEIGQSQYFEAGSDYIELNKSYK